MRDHDENDAIAWAVRVSDPDFADWDGLADWLGEDAARADAYRRATVAIDDAAAAMAVVRSAATPAQAAPDAPHVSADVVALPVRADRRHPSPRRWWLPVGSVALAAGIAAILVIGKPVDVQANRVFEAPAGQARRIALIDGSRIEMAGGTRLSFDPAHPRVVTMERGRAVFTVTHDETRPFRVAAGRHSIVDVGTAFEVVQASGATDVSVAEGAVVIDPRSMSVSLAAGEGAILRDGAAPRRLSVAPASVGQWRRDHMSYRDAALATVAADLSAALGRPVAVDAGLRTRRFTGSVAVSTVRDRPQELAALLDVRVRSNGDGWELIAR